MKLTKADENICSYTGTFGILITLTCLIQLFVYGLNHWVNGVFLLSYLFIIFCFAFLAFQKHSSPFLLIGATALALLLALTYFIIIRVISVIVIVLFLYSAAVTIAIFMDGLHLKLRQKELARRAEEEEWRGKI